MNIFTKKTVALIVVLVALAAAAWYMFGSAAGGLDYPNADKYTGGDAEITGAVNSLFVDWTSGKVTVEYWDGAAVSVSETASRTLSADEKFMKEALREARKASRNGETPIGCVIVHTRLYDGTALQEPEIIARGRNRREALFDATAHAEIEALVVHAAGQAVVHVGAIGAKAFNGYHDYSLLRDYLPMISGSKLAASTGREK